jgi:acyl-CoA synthetase (AMP-forming)/AMP-acid ligase II
MNAVSRFNHLEELLLAGREDATALSGSGRPALTYGGLRASISANRTTLRQLGLGREDRVALVLGNGPEMAGAFLSIAASATACPLNPGYRADEFEFYLTDLKVKALAIDASTAPVAREVAKRLGIACLEVVGGAAAGEVALIGEAIAPAVADRPASAQDIALILHTSGTTSRPKLVPLSQRNVAASACNIRDSLALTDADVGLEIMPLFHIHGLIAGLLAPLAAGGAVFAAPAFNALKFFALLAEARPSWYTAVPTMHQAILARASHNVDVIARHPLRFLRSSSSSIAPQTIRELEATFNAPLIEAYGMTEAAHQMTSNPLPPGMRKPGSVGQAAGPEVAIMDADGVMQATNHPGEIVIRGANVTAGYENNASANATAFTSGWFRTGDEGRLDDDGYLFITGRLKEIINRGGEKISPREIDEILLDHAAVAQVVTFALPHPMLGEEVACAVVLKNPGSVSEKELRAFVAQHVADFKVPKKIIMLEEIPKGATGKVQRIGLAQKLGLT